ncbi:MAG: 2Fe-2S iron-sulfur cluster-binding protein, partial [Rectinemataceae bacterium]|nr:2Fe-2S iron-sulfur cluster-binding protein [Rectinemataceae bacterium]
GPMKIEFMLNGSKVSVPVRSGDRLADVLRERLGQNGVRPDCRSGRCGRCLVFLDTRLMPSCMIPAYRVRGHEILTVEGLLAGEEGRDIESAFVDSGLYTCGFCRSAKLMVTADLLRKEGHPREDVILENLGSANCRCTDPESLVSAVTLAAEYRARRLYKRAGK